MHTTHKFSYAHIRNLPGIICCQNAAEDVETDIELLTIRQMLLFCCKANRTTQ